MAHSPFGAVAREVVEAYGDDLMAHPVGTGPYVLKEWRARAQDRARGESGLSRLHLGFRAVRPAWDEALVAAMRGKKMPQIGRVEISVIEEEQSRWLAFNQKELDYLEPAGDVPRRRSFDADRQAEAGVDGARASSLYPRDRSRHHLHVLQLPRSAGRRLLEGEDRAAPRDHHGLQPTRRRSASSARARRCAPRCRFRSASSATIRTTAAQPLRSGAREQAARLLRLQEGQGRLPDAARRQAARDPARDRHVARSTASSTSCGRRSMDAIGIRIEFQHRQVRRPPEGGEGLPADDVAGRRGAPTIRTATTSCSCCTARTPARATTAATSRRRSTRSTRRSHAAARFARAQPAVPRDDAADGSRRRVEPAGVARAQPADLAVGQGLQEAPDPATPSSSTWTSSRGTGEPRAGGDADDAERIVPLDRCLCGMRSCCRAQAIAARRSDDKVDPRRVPGGRDRLRSGRRARPVLRHASCRRSSRRCYTYDYLARPAKLVPLTAEAHAADHRRRQDVHGQAQEGHPTSRRTRRSRASSASSSPRTTSIRSSA